MADDISSVFTYYGRKSNQFYEEELKDFLCPQPRAGEAPLATPLTFNTQVQLPGAASSDSYRCTLMKSADGKTISLDTVNIRGGKEYRTEMTAVKVSDNLYEVKHLLFDNKIERLDSRWEMTKVLAHIGKEQLQKACRGAQPEPHAESGKFGKLRRFLTRCMPDNPHPFTGFPPC